MRTNTRTCSQTLCREKDRETQRGIHTEKQRETERQRQTHTEIETQRTQRDREGKKENDLEILISIKFLPSYVVQGTSWKRR